MFAVVDIAGFQEKVAEGDKLKVALLPLTPGDTVKFEKVLLVSKGEDDMTLGHPYVEGASIEAKILSHGRGDKIRVYRMQKRKRFRKTRGHRQDFTEIEVMKIKA